MKKSILVVFISLFLCTAIFAQAPVKPTSGEIYESLKKLNFLGSVLYIAAHPDDENTRLISYFSNDVKARTAYLSITRGDGGQNLIGTEIRELLGVIRTQELLAARKIDGGEQFFTRANDFGFSKHPDETLSIWNKEKVLKDVVALIRKFKPDVIINRFNHRTPGKTHGQHTSSAILGIEAFDLANDSSFKTYLPADNLWQPKRLFFNTSWWFYGSKEKFEEADKTNLLRLNIGAFYPYKGLSNSEIASLSRSQHQSQGFGSTGSRGDDIEYLEFIKGDFPSNKNIFDGIDTSWNRIEGGKAVAEMLEKVIKEYDFNKPSKSIDGLLEVYNHIENLNENHWKPIKLKEVKNIILACAGLYLEAVANDSYASASADISVNFEAINRSDAIVELEAVSFSKLNLINEKKMLLQPNNSVKFKMDISLPKDMPLTSPYWLLKKGSLGMYEVSEDSNIGLPETPKTLKTTFVLKISGETIPFEKNIVYKYNDPVKGEVYKPFEILPEVSATFNEEVYIFSSNKEQKVDLKIKSAKKNISGNISLKVPPNWKVYPKEQSFQFKNKGEEQLVEFQLTPPMEQFDGIMKTEVRVGDELFNNNLIEINYNHIPFQTISMPSEAKIVRLNIEKKGQLIGYIHGAGDLVPSSLRQIGYTVVELNEEDIYPEKLKNFDAVILGIRAYNTNDRAKYYQKHLHDYVKTGGTLIVQYNTNRRLKVDTVAPYKINISRDRVADENSVVSITNPTHEILNFPNKITMADFEGWVQERGLYFPNEWDENFETVISMHDTNEKPKNGSILITKFGKGNFIYTGLSFFRELPAGVPGAYKLLTNMISIGKNTTKKPLKD